MNTNDCENKSMSVLEYLMRKNLALSMDIEKNMESLPEAYALNHPCPVKGGR